jgi:hypothetical protein
MRAGRVPAPYLPCTSHGAVAVAGEFWCAGLALGGLPQGDVGPLGELSDAVVAADELDFLSHGLIVFYEAVMRRGLDPDDARSPWPSRSAGAGIRAWARAA